MFNFYIIAIFTSANMYFECRSMQYSDNDGCEGFVL